MGDYKLTPSDISLPQEKLNSIYRGVVEDNNDPLKAGRCKVRIFGIHTENKEESTTDGIPTANLLWAEPAIPIFGGISKTGIFGVPYCGAHVFLFFEGGNIMQPRYFATVPGIPKEPANPDKGFYDPNGEFPTTPGEADWNENDEDNNTVYPNAFVIQDKVGNKIVMDSTENHERIYIEHGKSRARIGFNSDGSIIKDSGAGTEETYTGSLRNTVRGDKNETITGTNSITCKDSGETVINQKKVMIHGTLDESVLGVTNKKAKSLSYNIDNDAEISVGGKTEIRTENEVNIKSIQNTIKLEALARNIELLATLGEISGSSMTLSVIATLTAELKGMISTTVGGGVTTDVKGIITTIDGSALTMIKGGVIMIG